MQLTYEEIIDILDIEYIAGSTNGYTLPPGVYVVSDLKLMLKSLLHDDVKVSLTMDDIGLRSNLTANKTI